MGDYVVLKPEGRPLSSAIKTFYFLVFFSAGVTFFFPFFTKISDFWNALPSKPNTRWDAIFFTVALVIFYIVIFFHFIRLYITLELLEDPTTDFHKIFIYPLGNKARFAEQIIRFLLILCVSFKIIDLFKHLLVTIEVNTNPDLSKYILVLYVVLLLWDIVYVMASHWNSMSEKIFDNKLSSLLINILLIFVVILLLIFCPKTYSEYIKIMLIFISVILVFTLFNGKYIFQMYVNKTYFWMNSMGILASGILLIFYPAKNNNNSSFFLSIGAISLIIVMTVRSFIRDYNNRETRKEFKMFLCELVQMMRKPFYGERYKLEEKPLYHPVNGRVLKYKGLCEKENCTFTKALDETIALKPNKKKDSADD
ncbi:MAG TPA: hypothetical protein ACFYEF_07335 [Candidatus Wunengus sp. YC63]|uniref:hypothetical protein n=1 Tax=Candidatus Wunengus sp. YC63 TaxID=3367699 RepID=UPI0040282B23